jgi:hypothetical protein
VFPLGEACSERLRRERGNRALWRDAGNPFGSGAETLRLCEEVRDARCIRCHARPLPDSTEGIRMARAQTPRVIVREELRLVGGHVHVHRAVALAPLAGEAEVERVFHGFAPPSICKHLALNHLEEEPRPAARGVFLFARHHEARTHCCALEPAARTHTDTAQRRPREAAAVIAGKAKMRRERRRLIFGAKPQVLVDTIGVHELARIHLASGIPDRLELGEGLHQFRTEHSRQELGTRLAVAVLARERAT